MDNNFARGSRHCYLARSLSLRAFWDAQNGCACYFVLQHLIAYTAAHHHQHQYRLLYVVPANAPALLPHLHSILPCRHPELSPSPYYTHAAAALRTRTSYSLGRVPSVLPSFHTGSDAGSSPSEIPTAIQKPNHCYTVYNMAGGDHVRGGRKNYPQGYAARAPGNTAINLIPRATHRKANRVAPRYSTSSPAGIFRIGLFSHHATAPHTSASHVYSTVSYPRYCTYLRGGTAKTFDVTGVPIPFHLSWFVPAGGAAARLTLPSASCQT